MKNISILDCTLRDGGYVNNWVFGQQVINKIVRKIFLSGIEIAELGYLSTKDSGNPDVARYSSVDDIRRAFVANKNADQSYAVMINLGEYPLELLPKAKKDDPIFRVAFHKKDIDKAFDYFDGLSKLGYRFFIQPMGVLNYSDEEFIRLINKSNATSTEAFYIVDSFGVIEMKDFRRLIFIADSNLKQNIALGYHAHNNLQQAYSNAKYMTEQLLVHDLIIDASVFGMGRGAGNLNIELFSAFLNQDFKKNYKIDSLLEIFDECLKPIFLQQFWGYSLPYYLSSIHNCHPNYASYFAGKNTLSVKSMHEILGMISDADKGSFTKEKAIAYYNRYQENFVEDGESLDVLSKELSKQNILILAPGNSLNTHQETINNFIRSSSPIIIGVNSYSDHYVYDYLFLSNEKRINGIIPENIKRIIKTSNIRKTLPKELNINYSSFLCRQDKIASDATLMLLNMLITIGIKNVYIAGFDGFSSRPDENYFEKSLSMGSLPSFKEERNESISAEIKNMQNRIGINFITPSRYITND